MFNPDQDFDDFIDWNLYRKTRCGLIADYENLTLDKGCRYDNALTKLECYDYHTGLDSSQCMTDLRYLMPIQLLSGF